MALKKLPSWLSLWRRAESFLEEDLNGERKQNPALRRLRVTAQFFHRVVYGFRDNRCPLRAAALCYTTLLALVPLLAVAFSISRGLLKETSATVVPKMLDALVDKVAPQLVYLPANGAPAADGQVKVSDEARRQVVDSIQQFLSNIDTGVLGTIGTVALILVVLQLLTTIENTFNDIWGIATGRPIWRKVVYYWAVVTLGSVFVVTAITMTGSAEFTRTVGVFMRFPILGKLLMEAGPFVLLWIGFTALYGLMPNTRVHWNAAVVGGIVGGTLWQLNSILNAMYISRVFTYSKIYGGLGVIPVFLVGLYLSWWIVLFGAQVSYAVQNYRTFFLQRASQRLDQLSRERIACRLMLFVCRRFLHNQPPPGLQELSEILIVPAPLVNQLVQKLIDAGLLVELAGDVPQVQPARLPSAVTIGDVLHVLRVNLPEITPAETDAIDAMLGKMRVAERTSGANLRFSDLVEQTDAETLPDRTPAR